MLGIEGGGSTYRLHAKSWWRALPENLGIGGGSTHATITGLVYQQAI